jgi:prepilin peptidase CpaA
MNTAFLVPLMFAVLALAGAVSDLRSRRIPNALSAAIAICGIIATWISGGGDATLSALGHLVVALAIGMAIYALGMWGGGDAKFYAATAAWFTLAEFWALVLAISLAGLALLVVWFTFRRLLKLQLERGRRGELPYGVAIAAGGISIMAAQTF